MILCFPRDSQMTTLVVLLMVLGPFFALAVDTSAHFLNMVKHECHFSNGTERVRFMDRYFYNGAEYMRFDSDVGEFQAMNELGQPIVESLESRKDLLEKQRSAVNIYCKHNYHGAEILIKLQIGTPLVTVFPAKTQTLNHHNLLVCSANGFYPGHIKVKWFRNGQEQESGVISTGLIRNGDWTFQTLVMLETVPESGDIYVCLVEHLSMKIPISVEWRAQTESAQRKMLSGIGGFVLGLVFFVVGLFINYRNQKGNSGLQPTGLLS